jgi:hypothetical protein
VDLAKLESVHLDLTAIDAANAATLLELPALRSLRCNRQAFVDPDVRTRLEAKGVAVTVYG